MGNIRKAGKSDIDAIVAIAKVLSTWFTPSARRNIRRSFRNQQGYVFLRGKPVGFILYRKWKHTAAIMWLGVMPSEQRKGAGSRLLRSAETECKKSGICKMKVTTLSYTTKYKPYEGTRRFYRKMGFRKLHINKRYYPDGSDRLVLLKEL